LRVVLVSIAKCMATYYLRLRFSQKAWGNMLACAWPDPSRSNGHQDQLAKPQRAKAQGHGQKVRVVVLIIQ
jgi:hypothetical protein